MKYAFVRERVGSAAAISLVFRDSAQRLPLVRTIWLQSFADEESRDRFFAWMSRRLDRWNEWGGTASSKGAAALTRHLLSMLASELKDDGANEEEPGVGAPMILSIPYHP